MEKLFNKIKIFQLLWIKKKNKQKKKSFSLILKYLLINSILLKDNILLIKNFSFFALFLQKNKTKKQKKTNFIYWSINELT